MQYDRRTWGRGETERGTKEGRQQRSEDRLKLTADSGQLAGKRYLHTESLLLAAGCQLSVDKTGSID
jgi:hypothetical protein